MFLEITLKYFELGEITYHIIYSPLHELSKRQSCRFCGVKCFQYEPPNFCCYNGQVVYFLLLKFPKTYTIYTFLKVKKL